MPAAAAAYHVSIAHEGRGTDARVLQRAIADAASRVTSGRVAISFGPLTATARLHPGLLIVLASHAATTSPTVATQIAYAQGQVVPVLPVFSAATSYTAQVPAALHPINGMSWSSVDPPDQVAQCALRLLGIADVDRRIFVSYRRTDGSAVAESIRMALLNAGWDVFLDRFSVPPAVDFQQRLDVELADKAFVLLIESPDAAGSQWVSHEVGFALRHGMGLMSLTLPTTRSHERFPGVPDAMRYLLTPSHIVTGGTMRGALTPAAGDVVVAEVEARHATSLRLRREILLLSVQDALRIAGRTVTQLDESSVLGTSSAHRDLVRVVSRAPSPADLRTLDKLRTAHAAGRGGRGWLVHPTEDVDHDRAELIRWMTAHRRLKATPIMLFERHMT